MTLPQKRKKDSKNIQSTGKKPPKLLVAAVTDYQQNEQIISNIKSHRISPENHQRTAVPLRRNLVSLTAKSASKQQRHCYNNGNNYSQSGTQQHLAATQLSKRDLADSQSKSGSIYFKTTRKPDIPPLPRSRSGRTIPKAGAVKSNSTQALLSLQKKAVGKHRENEADKRLLGRQL